MKLIAKSLAALAALALAQSAMAQTDVYITGSTAFRSGVLSLLGTPGAVFTGTPTEAYAGSSATGATYANFTGTVSGSSVRIKCSFTGSAGGIFLVANNGNATPPKAIFLADGASGTGLANPTTGTGDVHTCDMTFSDVFQTSSAFQAPVIPNDTQVGIVTFKWVGNYSLAQNSAAGTAITGITSQHVKALFSGAFLESAAQITGSTTALDQKIYVFAMGRDFDSGTRINAFADSGNGATTSPFQWQPWLNNSGTVGNPATNNGSDNWVGTPAGSPVGPSVGVNPDLFVAKLQQWNAKASYQLYNNTLTVTNGDGGFNSGGDLAKMMRCDSNSKIPAYYNASLKTSIGYGQACSGAYMITYLGISDAGTAIAAPVAGTTFGTGAAKELTYNGVTYSNAAIEQGQYSFWSYEHLLSNNLTGAANNVYNALANAVESNSDSTQGGAGLLLSVMQVGRLGDGGAATAIYY